MFSECQNIDKLWSGEWSLNNTGLCKEVISSGLEAELVNIVKHYRDTNNGLDDLLHIAISSILTFCDQNWNPHPVKLNLEEYIHLEWPDIDVCAKLQKDSEPIFGNIVHPELLYLSHQVFNALYSVEQNLVCNI